MSAHKLTRRNFITLISAGVALPAATLELLGTADPANAQGPLTPLSSPLISRVDLVFYGPGFIGTTDPEVRAIGIAPNGDIWVGSSGRLTVFGSDGAYKEPGPASPGQVNSIVWDAKGDLIVGANDGFWARYVNGDWQRTGGFGSYSPWEVAIDPDGFVYATDGGGGVVRKFNTSGTLLLVYKAEGPGVEPMVRPFSLALDPQGRIYVSDERKTGLWIFDKDGKFIQRLLPDTQCWRVRYRADGLYVVTNNGVSVLDPAVGTVKRQIAIPGGYDGAMGFAIDPAGNFYTGSHYSLSVQQYSPEGKPLQVIGPSYRATLTVPDSWTPGQQVIAPLKVEPIASKPVGKIPPSFALVIQPVTLPGEPDSNWADLQGTSPDPAWWQKRQDQYAAMEKPFPSTPAQAALQVNPPADIDTNVYRLVARVDNGTTAGTLERDLTVRVIQPGADTSATLFVPRQRSVFQQGETLELNVIIRSRNPVPAGSLRFTLARGPGTNLERQPTSAVWKEFPVPAMPSGTLTFQVDTGSIHQGRYFLQVEYRAGNKVLRDVWPLQVTSPVEPTRFRILFPEWSAGYTDIWGPYTGKGMAQDAANLAARGILLYDTLVVERGQSPQVAPSGPEADWSREAVDQAAKDLALPAAERFMAASPLEIELQEALRNGMQVQRDFWGSHFLDNWGYGTQLGIERDNRIARLWTQWQREWPSWIGHRYLTLSIDEGDNPERVALLQDLKAKGLVPPTEADLDWARNGYQREFISDAPVPVSVTIGSCGADKDGNVYIGAADGSLLKYAPDGALIRQTNLHAGNIDIYVASDGTVYAAHDDTGSFSITTPDGTSKTIPVPMGQYSPRGICLAPDGSVLVSDLMKSRVRRFTVDGKLLGDIGSENNLGQPAGVATLKDGTIYVADGAKGGLMVFKADGTPVKFLPGIGGHSPGGKMGLCAAPDDTLWVTGGGVVLHVDRDGKLLGSVGHNTFAPGGISLAMSVATMPNGNILVADVTLPYVQQLTPAGDPVHLYGMNKLLLDVRIDRHRYTWEDRIIATVWKPVQGQEGDPNSTLSAAYQLAANGPWLPLKVEAFSGGDYGVEPPRAAGKITLRLAWGPAAGLPQGAPLPHADYSIEMEQAISPADSRKLADILERQQAWKQAWSHTRMGTLVRWTELSDEIRPGTRNTAPTNYGTPDTLAEGVWVPYRRDAVVAECENVGHDHGSYPLMGPWYVSRAFEGPDPKPAWCSLLEWYWGDDKTPPRVRPFRDVTLLLGAGASGIGVGKAANTLNDAQRALHDKIVTQLHRLGEAMMELDLPGQGGVAVLHSFTEEAMDSYNDEQFYAAHAAWYDLLRAHIPAAVVSEETIAGDGLPGRFKAVLLPYVQHPLPAATMAGLDRFRKMGGQVWIDLGCRIKPPGATTLRTRYRPFWIEDAYYWMHSGYGLGAYDGNYEYFRMRQGSNDRLPAVREAFSQFAIRPVQTEDPDIYLQQRTGGVATYIFASNDHFPDLPLYKTWLSGDAPVPANSKFDLYGPVVYDAFAMQPAIKTAPGLQELPVEFTDAAPSRIWAVLPRPIGGLALQARLIGSSISVQVTVKDNAGAVLPAVVPLEISVTDAVGDEQYHLWRSTARDGVCTLRLPVRWMSRWGLWHVTARDLLSGKEAAPAGVPVGAELPATITRVADPALVFDRNKISTWLQGLRGQEVWVALDNKQEDLQAEASALAAGLAKRGILAKIVSIPAIPEKPLVIEHTLTPDQQAMLDQARAGQIVGVRQRSDAFRAPGPQRVIMRPLILLGAPDENRWLKDIDDFHLVPRPLSPGYPGPGRALVQFVWTPFYDGFDAVTISSVDPAGARAGIQSLLGILSAA